MESISLPKVSIIVLTYNAPSYVRKTLKTLSLTNYPNYEVVVFDNSSRLMTKLVLLNSLKRRRCSRLVFSDKNLLFAEGNNQGFKAVSEDADYVLLLNSDVKINDPEWLSKLVKVHQRGISSLGACLSAPIRADGYCLMIDKDLYAKYKLNTDFQWWWSVTQLQANILKDGFTVRAVKNHDHLLYHYGGASGDAWKRAKGMNIDVESVVKWFEDKDVEVLETL